MHAVQVVPHFVREEYEHQAGGEGNAQQQLRRVVPDLVEREGRKVAVVIVERKGGPPRIEVCLHVRADHQRGEDGGEQKQRVQPVTRTRARRRQVDRDGLVVLHRRGGNGVRWVGHRVGMILNGGEGWWVVGRCCLLGWQHRLRAVVETSTGFERCWRVWGPSTALAFGLLRSG